MRPEELKSGIIVKNKKDVGSIEHVGTGYFIILWHHGSYSTIAPINAKNLKLVLDKIPVHYSQNQDAKLSLLKAYQHDEFFIPIQPKQKLSKLQFIQK